MKKEIAEAWVKDLREYRNPNGGPAQCADRLSDGKGAFCCLGRLAILLGAEIRGVMTGGDNSPTAKFYTPDCDGYEFSLLPTSLADKAGMHDVDGRFADGEFLKFPSGGHYKSLAMANDSGESFEAIADVIEQNWERL